MSHTSYPRTHSYCFQHIILILWYATCQMLNTLIRFFRQHQAENLTLLPSFHWGRQKNVSGWRRAALVRTFGLIKNGNFFVRYNTLVPSPHHPFLYFIQKTPFTLFTPSTFLHFTPPPQVVGCGVLLLSTLVFANRVDFGLFCIINYQIPPPPNFTVFHPPRHPHVLSLAAVKLRCRSRWRLWTSLTSLRTLRAWTSPAMAKASVRGGGGLCLFCFSHVYIA